MSFYFFDTSGLMKAFVNEIGSAWVRNTIGANPPHLIYVAEITEVEPIAALSRRLKGKSITLAEFQLGELKLNRNLQNHFLVTQTNSDIIKSAVQLAKNYCLRGYDAVQLASAIQVENELISLNLPNLIFVSSDNELNNAANSEGLKVENPNNYS
jgi:uncharacterized protein